MNQDILILGATGTVGSAIVNELQQENKPFWVGVRNAQKLNTLPQRIIDYSNLSSFHSALKGIKGLFMVAPSFSHGKIEKAFHALIEEAKNQAVEHIVYLSALGAEQNPESSHRQIELMIEASGINFTFLRPNFFMQNFTTFERANLENGIIYLPTGDGKASYIDVMDIAKVFSKVILNPQHYNKAYALTGEEALSSKEIAAIFSKVLGKEVQHIDPSDEEYLATLRQHGLDEAGAQINLFLYSFIKNGFVAAVSPTVREITGQTASQFEEFAKTAFTISTSL